MVTALRAIVDEVLDYSIVAGLCTETQGRQYMYHPKSIGQTVRLEGLNPTDITLLTIAMEKCGKLCWIGMIRIAFSCNCAQA